MDVSSIALQGLDQAQSLLQRTATRLASAGTQAPAGAAVDTVDLSQQAVDLLTAKTQFAANIAVLKIADEMQAETANIASSGTYAPPRSV